MEFTFLGFDMLDYLFANACNIPRNSRKSVDMSQEDLTSNESVKSKFQNR